MRLLLIILLLAQLAGCASELPWGGARSAPERPETPRIRNPFRAPAPAPVEAAPADEARVLAAVSEENSIFFASSETGIDAEGRAKLQRHAARLKGDDKLLATLVGQTDDLGSGAYNLAIAEQRAEAVFKALRALGVPANQLRAYGVGAEKVSKACRSAECRRKMRRVEIRYSP